MPRSANSSNASNQAVGMVEVVLDEVYDPPLVGLLVQNSGDVNVVAQDGSQVVIGSFSGILPVFVRQVLTSGTTATGIIGLVG